MTTQAEKVALDVIFKALDSGFPDPSQRIMALFGLLSHLCIEQGVPWSMAEDAFRNRFREYQLKFSDENRHAS